MNAYLRGRELAEATLTKRGERARSDVAAALRRLPDGQFAPRGTGQILHSGDKVKLPSGETGVVKEAGAVHVGGKKVGMLKQPEAVPDMDHALGELLRGFGGSDTVAGRRGKSFAYDDKGRQKAEDAYAGFGKGGAPDVAGLVAQFLQRGAPASPGLKVGPIPGTNVVDSPGRGPTGKLRNFKAMSDEKLKQAIHDLQVHGLDAEAISNANGEASHRNLWSAISAGVEAKFGPKPKVGGKKPSGKSKAAKPNLASKLQAEQKASASGADPDEELKYERDKLKQQDEGLEKAKGSKIYSASLHADVKKQLADAEAKLGGSGASGNGTADPAVDAALAAYKAAGGTDPAVIAALSGGGSSSPEPAAGSGSEAGTGGGMGPNAQNLGLEELPIGAHFKTNDGKEWVLHKKVGEPWYIVKPTDGGKAKPMHGKFPPAMVDLSGGSSAPTLAPAASDPWRRSLDELYDKLQSSVAQAKKKGKLQEAAALEEAILNEGLWDAIKHPRGRGGEWASKFVDAGAVRERNALHGRGAHPLHPYPRFTKSGTHIRTSPQLPSRTQRTLDQVWHSKPARMAKNKWAELHLVWRTMRDPRVSKAKKAKLAAAFGAAIGAQFAAPVAMDALLGPAGGALGMVGPDDLLTGALLHHAVMSARGEEPNESKNGGIHPHLANALRAVHANDTPTIAMHELAKQMTGDHEIPGVLRTAPASPGVIGRRDDLFKRRAA